MSEYKNIESALIHGGIYGDKYTKAVNVPIYQTSTYEQSGIGETPKWEYSRTGNPTRAALEALIAELEGGVGAMLTASGQAANMIAITNICHAGDHVVSAAAIYGGTFNLFNKSLRELGIDFTFLRPDATEEEIAAAFRDNTKAVFIESVSNPSLDVADIETYVRQAHAHGVPLIVDNTFPTPVNFRPIEWGADIVTHSTTKYMDGHAVALGGVIVDSGNFDWTNGKFPMFTEPDESYHGVVYSERFGVFGKQLSLTGIEQDITALRLNIQAQPMLERQAVF